MRSEPPESSRNAQKRLPLSGVRVVDLTQVVSGAVTTMLMADFGAEVIKIEPPTGEPYRKSGYEIFSDAGETNLNILRFTRGKQSVAVDLKSSEGQEILRRLIERADVLVENFRPGVLARLGFDRQELERINRTLVYTSVSGFGHDDLYPSPYRDRPAYAIITEALAGLTHLAGDHAGPPVWMGFAMADIFAGTLAFAGTLLSLMDNEKAGRRVDIAMFDASLLMNDLAIAAYSIVGETLGPGQYLLQSPWGPFETSDGYVVVAVLMNEQWRALCGVIGRDDLADHPELRTGVDRSRAHETLVAPPIAEWCRGRTKDECSDLLTAAGVPAAVVNTPAEAMTSPQTAARDMLLEVDNQVTGPVRVVGNPIKLDANREPINGSVPGLGRDTVAVLTGQLGLSEDEVTQLLDKGVVAGAKPSLSPVSDA
jgi:crotonobetainyl-CoA:carnitine CoA-transferase CaiB-like acyl-CoA transferase